MRFYTMLAIIALMVLSACSKSKDCDYRKATVIRYDCDRVILQLSEDYPIGEDNWYDANSGERYDNVVSCLNICTIREVTRAVPNATVYVKLKETTRTDGEVCLVCVGIPLSAPAIVVEATAVSASQCR
ncbi:MAG: hypothetical protein ABS85_00640 [Sphingobacteriales bacterium SCN 48-20]|jgi:hypothetical protein|uniref:hypothetical protein n=1 Tax=Terrimonas ferruginea TaxID=249 RepID=UPI00086B5A37|nr:hypothetical protein [Terrimonas ferruginea]MBN8785339.1 hypothetical protein [Terrimonas ferruginea]ODT95759.1 MAG: hypothetical protein ABS85_00640 [Sphingobacteriales bacterium SCN 48-20]OJW43762.1 MAG: hypothetical protein BGO56_05545 [Sphingobacteriales bacterium 48-107]